MITPIIMLVLLLSPCVGALAWGRFTRRAVDTRRAGVIGIALVFAFAGFGHFVQTAPMAQMLPPWVPGRFFLLYLTGVLEFAIALGLLIPRFRQLSAWTAAVVLVGFFPAKVYAALNHVPLGGHAWGPAYLLLRAPSMP